MQTLLLRKATLDDLDDLVEFENACFTSDKLSRKNFTDMLNKNRSQLYMGLIEEELAALGILSLKKNSKRARIYSIAVKQTFRQLGLAAEMTKHMEIDARQLGCKEMVLEVRPDNDNAIKFYEKNGYTKFATYDNFYEDGADAIRMKKDLFNA